MTHGDMEENVSGCFLSEHSVYATNNTHKWPCSGAPGLRSRGCRFESHPWLLCTNANSECHPSGVS